MLPPPTYSPPDPLIQQNHSLAPQHVDFDAIARMLQELSLSQGIWNGVRIGSVYGGLLGFLASLCMQSTYQQPFVLFPLLFGTFAGTLVGLSVGLCAGLWFGWLGGAATVQILTRSFRPLRTRRFYRFLIGFFYILLVIGTFFALAIASPLIREIFTIYAPGMYLRHTFSRPEYILITFGLGYGAVLATCLYSWSHAGMLARRYVHEVGGAQTNMLIAPDSAFYDYRFQQQAFGALSGDYGRAINLVSLGQSDTLRARLVKRMHLAPGMAVCDLMTGGGEMWPHLLPLIGPDGTITAVDFTPEMIACAQKRLDRLPARPAITLHQANACTTGLPDEHFDAVVCAFGISAMTPTQFDNMLEEVHRILRPGGIFGFVELSRPANPRLRRWMDRYLTGVTPALTDLLDIDTRAHHLLNTYLSRFDNELLLPSFHMRRYTFYRYELFGGWAVAFVGMKEIG